MKQWSLVECTDTVSMDRFQFVLTELQTQKKSELNYIFFTYLYQYKKENIIIQKTYIVGITYILLKYK